MELCQVARYVAVPPEFLQLNSADRQKNRAAKGEGAELGRHLEGSLGSLPLPAFQRPSPPGFTAQRDSEIRAAKARQTSARRRHPVKVRRRLTPAPARAAPGGTGQVPRQGPGMPGFSTRGFWVSRGSYRHASYV